MLIPFTMPATLRTIDMSPVYDGTRTTFTVRMPVWAVLMLGLGLGTADAQNQPRPTPLGQVEGIGMGWARARPRATIWGMNVRPAGCTTWRPSGFWRRGNRSPPPSLVSPKSLADTRGILHP